MKLSRFQAVKLGMGLYEYRGHILERIIKDGRAVWQIKFPYHAEKYFLENLSNAKDQVDISIENWFN